MEDNWKGRNEEVRNEGKTTMDFTVLSFSLKIVKTQGNSLAIEVI